MKKLVVDLTNYKKNGTFYKRAAARGIIRRDGRYLAVCGSRYGDCKFPGGGKEPGEELTDTLIREVKEETGYDVMPETVREYMEVFEIRKGYPEDILEMESIYYFCDVTQEAGERDLDGYEVEYGYEVEWLSLEEMIKRNEKVQDVEHAPWVIRETRVMRELADFL